MVVLPGIRNGDTDEQCLTGGREQVRHLVRIARELPETPGPAASPVRRNQVRPDGVARRPDQPGAGRTAWPAARDRR